MRPSTPRRSSGPAGARQRGLARRAAGLFVALLCLAALSPTGARAQGQAPAGPAQRRNETIAITRLPFQGVTREVEASLRQGLREALQLGGFDVAPDADVEGKLQRDPELSACTSRSCFAREALTLGALRVVEGEVKRPQRSTYQVRLQLRDLRSGQLGPPEEERCDVCGAEEARQMLARVAGRLCRAAPPLKEDQRAPDTGTLQVDSQPLRAEVLIDGERQEDRTPATFILPVGVHSLELRAPGHKALRRPVEISPGRHLALNLELIAVAPRRPWLTALSGVMLGAGLGLGLTSGILWGYHGKPAYGQPSEDPCLSPQARCPFKYDNRALGSVTAGLGAALIIGGAVAVYYDYAPPRRRIVIAPALPTAQALATP